MIQMLQDISLGDRGKYGSKAAVLGFLLRNGICVPAGFAIASRMFSDYLEFNRISYAVRDYWGYNDEIVRGILQGSFPADMEEDIFEKLSSISKNKSQVRFAVRSSALCEDNKSFSMAGMFASYINLKTKDEVLQGIKRCYASLFTEKVLAYAANNNMDMKMLQMGVVIQLFVEGSPSGVCFTADTIHMDTEVMYINFVNGLCRQFVSGDSASSFYKVSKATGEVKEQYLCNGASAMTDDAIQKLLQQAKRVEALLEDFQDIEWTFTGDGLYILQARPVTTLKNPKFPVRWDKESDKEYKWSRFNHKIFSPLMQEIVAIQLENWTATGTGKNITSNQNGYIYLRREDREPADRDEIQKMLKALYEQQKDIYFDVVLPQIKDLKDKLDAYVSKDLSEAEILVFMDLATIYLIKASTLHFHAWLSRKYRSVFEDYCREINKDIGIQELYDLTYKQSIVTKEREMLFEMAEVVSSSEELTGLFKEYSYNETLYAHLNRLPSGKPLLERMNNYLKDFGICETGYDEILHRTHASRPDCVVGYIRNFLQMQSAHFRSTLTSSVQNKKRVLCSLVKNLDKKQKEEFLSFLGMAEKSFLSEDEHNYYMERICKGYLFTAVTYAAEKLCRFGLLNDMHDIQFLTLAEIRKALSKQYIPWDIIEKRKTAHREMQKYMAPPSIGANTVSVPAEDRNKDKGGEKDKKILKGLSGLRKTIQGKITVGIPKALRDKRILVLESPRGGSILNIIANVDGFIFEKGSPFDHFGIIARELGLPAIYNVENATKILKEGDRVEMDGVEGKVLVL